MTLPMLDALRTETVRLQVSVDDDTGAHIDAYAPYRYRLASEHFYFIIIRVLNLSRTRVRT